MWTVYALIDPRTMLIRYVGQTQNHPLQRLEGHKRPDNKSSKVYAWLYELKRLGEKPQVAILEYVENYGAALETEGFWIRCGRRSGWPLLNQSSSTKTSLRRVRQHSAIREPKPPPPTKWEKAVQEWFEQNPTAVQGEVNGKIADLARYMAVSIGQPDNWKNYKSSAHSWFHRYRKLLNGDSD